MKITAKALLGLMAVAWLVVEYRPRPIAATDASAVSTPHPTPNGRFPPSARRLKGSHPPEESRAEMPAFETSWAKELRRLRELAANDPDAALAEVAQMPDKHERKTAAWTVCLLLAPKDPETAMTAAWDLELGKFADEAADNAALESLAKQWAEANLLKAFVWASALPADEEWRRDRVMKGIASTLSQFAPAEAARLVDEYINPDSNVRMDAAIEVLHRWAARDYVGALDWVALSPEGAIRNRGIEELAGALSSQLQIETKPN